ncbi:glycosyltransferase [Rhodocista pekingensis]|uniref:Glycosyltransferase n=1 Tax=Rhodocista pekingensis TaxID=201185 RepID=A0ABW2KXZ6_9PROT
MTGPRVLRVIGGLDPAFGGPSVSAVTSAVAAVAAGVPTDLVFPAPDPDEAMRFPAVRLLREGGVGVRCVPLLRLGPALSRSLGVSPDLARHLRRQASGYDLLHAHGAWTHATLAAMAAAGAAGLPFVLSPHEGLTRYDLSHARAAPLRIAKHLLKRRYEARCAAIVYSSGLERRDSASPSARARGLVIHHAVVDDGMAVPDRPRPEGGTLRLGFLGRIHPKKNLGVLIRALALLPPQVTLTVAGDGEDGVARGLRALAGSEGVAGRIDWRGFVTGGAKDRFLAGIDLLCMPSAYECFGMAAVEALARGVPVLLSPDCGVAAPLADAGAALVVEPRPGPVAVAVGALLADVDRWGDLSSRGLDAARASFSFSAHGAALRALYSSLSAASARDAGWAAAGDRG